MSSIQLNLYKSVTASYRYNLHLADFNEMRELLERIDWEGILCPLDIHAAWHLFSIRFTDVLLDVWIPFGMPRPKKNLFITHIYMHRALRLKNKECKLWINYYNLYCQVRNEL